MDTYRDVSEINGSPSYVDAFRVVSPRSRILSHLSGDIVHPIVLEKVDESGISNEMTDQDSFILEKSTTPLRAAKIQSLATYVACAEILHVPHSTIDIES